jgi:carbamoyltransferase
MDLAASIQHVTEQIVVRAARHLQAATGMTNLCLAGGVALNCVANSRILRDTAFERIWVQPAAGDAGGSVGAALFVWHQLLDNKRPPFGQDRQRGSFLGPRYSRDEVVACLSRNGADGNVVGWFHGRMEFGPRALGARSILGDPRSPRMQSVMNQKIKFRESFRPFAPAVLLNHVDDWFERAAGEESPYMCLVAPVAAAQRIATAGTNRQGLDKLGVIRSTIPAVTHVDLSARLQTVDAERHSRFHLLLERFHQRTGCPVLVNTSFNVRGEPIVCSPDDAFRCFMATGMDALVLEDAVLLKAEQQNAAPFEVQRYLAEFSLD